MLHNTLRGDLWTRHEHVEGEGRARGEEDVDGEEGGGLSEEGKVVDDNVGRR